MWKEFKAFILKGNVIDLAVAVVIGAAFGKIVTSLVDNIIMPCIGVLTSGVDFADMKVVLQEAKGEEIPEIAIGYGVLINTVLQFLIVAFVIFLIVKIITKARAKAEAIAKKEKAVEAAKIAEDIALLTEIRDLLKADSAKGK